MIEINEIEKEFEELEQNDQWEDAFKNINTIDTVSQVKLTFVHAKHSSNERFNRYRNILPYDHSRIKLKEANDTDYINANLVETKLIDRKYILTQGPLKNTCENFWQMVWEKNTKGIIMLNKLYEKGFLKCEMYFPNADEENGDLNLKFGKFNLNYISEIPLEDFSIRTIECENLEQKETRQIYHLHFTNWPDFGEPEHTTSFLKFLNECKKRNIFDLNQYGPPIVHCSAGVGRSGTFILVDSMLELYRVYGDKIPIRVSNLLAEMRTCRMGLVQTHQQFKFAFQAIVDQINQIRSEKTESEIYTDDILIDVNKNGEKSSETDEELSEVESENDDDQDEEFNESENEQKTSNCENNIRRRPDTAKANNKSTKRFKISDEKKKKINKLRYLQQKNASNQVDEQISDITTAKPRTNGQTKNDLSSSENMSNEDNDDDTTPFAKSPRNIQTVRVNQERKPLDGNKPDSNGQIETEHNEKITTTIENSPIDLTTQETNTAQSSNSTLDNTSGNFQTNNIFKRNVQSSSTENFPTPSSVPRNRSASDKEKRIAEQVKQMKQKLIKHEQHQKLMSQLKPFLIGGSILLGGFLIFQLYKKVF